MSYLAPHPWDKYGPPPTPGVEPEPAHDWSDQEKRIARLMERAREADEEAEGLRSEADSAEHRAEEYRNEAEDIITDEIEKEDYAYGQLLREHFDLG